MEALPSPLSSRGIMGCGLTKEMKNCFYSFFYPFQTEVSSRPERSEVEGPAVHHPQERI
jgi:hypothetical protein